MMIGHCKFIGKDIYIIVNDSGTLEKRHQIKWFARLYLEIIQGFGKPMSLPKLRRFIIKHKKFLGGT